MLLLTFFYKGKATRPLVDQSAVLAQMQVRHVTRRAQNQNKMATSERAEWSGLWRNAVSWVSTAYTTPLILWFEKRLMHSLIEYQNPE
jgi:hypothetical protein